MKKTVMAFGGGILLLMLLAYARGSDGLPVSGTAGIKALPGQVDPYRTRSELLMKATSYTGVCTPEQAATVWSAGVELRSAALQYTVMTDRLKEQYAQQLDASGSNWVTGMSSPWIDSFSIVDCAQSDQGATIALAFEAVDSTGWAERYEVTLRLMEEGGFWRIDEVIAPDDFYPYTGYRR